MGRARLVGTAVAVVVGVAVAAGCGFLGAPIFQNARPANGIAPWGDLGHVPFCVGSEHIGSPGGQDEGVCVVAGAPAAVACQTDADCKSREECLCGACAVVYCDTNDDCTAGHVCDFATSRCDLACTTDADCKAGDRCMAGMCGRSCGTQADCQRGEQCGFDGTCDLAICHGDADCGGGTCEIERTPWDLREPSAIVLPVGPGGESRVVLYLERQDPTGGGAIYRAVADDVSGESFHLDPTTAVLSPDATDANRLGAPSVAADAAGSLWLAVATGDDQSIVLFQASDGAGKTFTRMPGVALAPSATWEAGHVGSPGLAALPASAATVGKWALVFTGGRQAALGAAVSADGVTFTALAQPILTPSQVADPVLWRNLDAIGGGQLVVDTDDRGAPLYRLWFHGHGQAAATAVVFGATQEIPPSYSVGYAAGGSLGGLVVYPFEPVFTRIELFLNYDSELSPAEVPSPTGTEDLLYYEAASPNLSSRDNLGVATNPPRLR
jgi:hypothetical protein